MPTCAQASTSTPAREQHDAARLRCSSGGPAGAFLTAIPGGRMTLSTEVFVVSVWRRLGHLSPGDVDPLPCKCSAGVATEAEGQSRLFTCDRDQVLRQNGYSRIRRMSVHAATKQNIGKILLRDPSAKQRSAFVGAPSLAFSKCNIFDTSPGCRIRRSLVD